MLEVLVRNYYERNGSFVGIEKTEIGDQLQKSGDVYERCCQLLGYTADEHATAKENMQKDFEKCENSKIFRNFNEYQCKVITLAMKFVLTSPSCIINYQDHTFLSAVLLWCDRESAFGGIAKNLRTKDVVSRALKVLHVKEIEDPNVEPFLRGTTIYCHRGTYESVKDVIKSATSKLASSVIGWGKNPLNLVRLLYKRKTNYYNLLKLACRYDMTVSDVFGMFNLSIPDAFVCKSVLGFHCVSLGSDMYLRVDGIGNTKMGSAATLQRWIMEHNAQKMLTQEGNDTEDDTEDVVKTADMNCF